MTIKVRTVCTILLLLLSCSLHAQKRVYLDYDHKKSTASEAALYRLYFPLDTGYKIEEYVAGTDKLYMTAYCTSPELESKQGLCTYYYEDGNKFSEGLYRHNKRTGDWKHYTDKDQQLDRVDKYDNDSLNGNSVSYYTSSGNVREKGRYANDKRIGVWTIYFDGTDHPYVVTTYVLGKNGALINTYYKNGKLKRIETDAFMMAPYGKCYDTAGNEIPFTPLQVLPKPTYSISTFLQNNMRYPDKARENNIAGRVVVQFYVEVDGTISHIDIVRPIGGGCSEEAKRVIAAMPPWLPGTYDDLPVKTTFTQPITFSLQ